KLSRRRPKHNFGQLESSNFIVIGAIDSIRPGTQGEELIDPILAHSWERENNVARCPRKVETARLPPLLASWLAVQRKVGVPIVRGGEFLPPFDFFQFVKAA